jgi:hypothetical protein
MSRFGLQLAVRHFGDGPTRKIAAAIFSLLACPLAINGVAAKDFPPVGGAGDYTFGALCPANQFLVGLTVKSGAWIDQMAIICAPVNPDGSTGSLYHDPKHYGGEGGGAATQKTCAPGQIINHMGFSLTAGNRQVLFFHFGCYSPTNRQTGTFELGANSPVFPPNNQDCPNGEAARGIQGRAGKHVNAVGLLCGPPPSVHEIIHRTGKPRPSGGPADGGDAPTATAVNATTVYKTHSGKDTAANKVCSMRPGDTGTVLSKGPDQWVDLSNISGACAGKSGWVWNAGDLKLP